VRPHADGKAAAMSPVAVSLILVAAFAHASWNLAAKRGGAGGTAFTFLYLAVSAVLLVPIAVLDVLLGGLHPTPTWVLAGAVSGALQVVYFLLLQRGYAVGDLSVVYPLARGTGPLLSVVFAILLLHERITPVALAGAAAVVCGVFVIGSGGSASADHRRVRASVGYALVTGLTIAAYTLWDGNAVTTLGVPPLVDYGIGAIVEGLALLPYALTHRPAVAATWRAHRAPALVVAVLAPLSYVLVLYAMRLAPVALVAPARELSIVIGGVLAWRLLGEPNPGRRLTGAAIVLTGIVALAVS
jgi:drug/metabolite transporter (DMT)-like permease